MFIQNLNTDQQSALLYLAKEVIKADGNLHELQMGMMDILKSQSNPNVQEQPIEVDKLSQLFDTKKVKHSLLFELIGVAYANGEYHLNEKNLITQYANSLNVNEYTLTQLESWVEKQLKLSKEAESLLN